MVLKFQDWEEPGNCDHRQRCRISFVDGMDRDPKIFQTLKLLRCSEIRFGAALQRSRRRERLCDLPTANSATATQLVVTNMDWLGASFARPANPHGEH